MPAKKSLIKSLRSDTVPVMLSGDRIIIFDKKLVSRLAGRQFGENTKEGLVLTLYEACFLLKEGKIPEPFCSGSEGKALSLKELLCIGEDLTPAFLMKFQVFCDLRKKRGFVVKSGIKFGCDFACYDKGTKIGASHSKWLIRIIPETAKIDYSEITGAARMAQAVKKRLLLASATERGPVYYEINHSRP